MNVYSVMATVIIHSELVVPPSWTPSVRDLTLYLSVFCGKPLIVLDCDGAEVDPFYKWLKPRGYADFIDEFVVRSRDGDGIHLRAHPPRLPRLAPEYMHYVIGSLRGVLRA